MENLSEITVQASHWPRSCTPSSCHCFHLKTICLPVLLLSHHCLKCETNQFSWLFICRLQSHCLLFVSLIDTIVYMFTVSKNWTVRFSEYLPICFFFFTESGGWSNVFSCLDIRTQFACWPKQELEIKRIFRLCLWCMIQCGLVYILLVQCGSSHGLGLWKKRLCCWKLS